MTQNTMHSFYAYLHRPRIGQRFSLLPGPFPPRQKRWKEALPWIIRAEMSDEQAGALQAACGIDMEQPEGQEQWDHVLNEFAHARLFVRVIPLHPEWRIQPGETNYEIIGRLKRWLAPPFVFNPATRDISWKTPVRFACPHKTITVPPRQAFLTLGTQAYKEVWRLLDEEKTMARWLDDGKIYIFMYHEPLNISPESGGESAE